MQAAVWHGHRDIRIEERPEPAAGAGQVRIKVAYAGICGTDRHEYTGPNFIPTTKPHRLTGKTAPLIMGHEFTGIIDQVGAGVTGWSAGDRVTANGTLCCGTCQACRSGRFNICERLGFLGVSDDGAFAEYVVVDAMRLFRIPQGITLRQALLAEPLSCGIHATRLLGDMENRSVVILGPGIIGLACFFAARSAGAGRILISGIGSARRSLIESYDGTYLDSSVQSIPEAVQKWNGGAPVDIAFECVGVQKTLDDALSVTAPGGKLMIMGVFEKPPVLDMNLLQEGERSILTSQAHAYEMEQALEQIAQRRLEPEALITREVTLDTLVAEGFEVLLKNPGEHIKIAIRIGGESQH